MSAMVKSACLILCVTLSIQASAQEIPWRQMEQVGEARLNFLFWPVYEARLFSEDGFSFPETLPFALELEYKRQFSSEAMVEETRRQWQAIGLNVREDWLEELERILTSVGKDDVLTLYANQAGHSVFYFNDRMLGVIEDSAFTEQFAAIWLSEQTTRPGFRENLLRSI